MVIEMYDGIGNVNGVEKVGESMNKKIEMKQQVRILPQQVNFPQVQMKI